ncbi:hypothetical protein OG530_19380 [Streptomyces decoyicus]|uniref:hypothetical protein n=1 Tax=Streptomyces decoyicus TaxID=249567 RepID=UPI002E19DB35
MKVRTPAVAPHFWQQALAMAAPSDADGQRERQRGQARQVRDDAGSGGALLLGHFCRAS